MTDIFGSDEDDVLVIASLIVISLGILRLRYPRRQRIEWRRPHIIRSEHFWTHDVLITWDNDEFKRHMRMDRDSFFRLCGLIQPFLPVSAPPPGAPPPVPCEKQVAVFLYRLANSRMTYRSLSTQFGIGRSTACEICLRISNIVSRELAHQWIKFPNDDNERSRVAATFARLPQGLEHCVGAIDGTHIPVRTSIRSYFNRKKFTSINVQAIADADLRFLDIFVGAPGSCNDARILRCSSIGQHGDNIIPRGYYLLGDSGYPLRRWLLTPYNRMGHLTPIQQHFNTVLSSNRQVVERAFGMLKNRFRMLKVESESLLDSDVDLIISAFALHNYCILQGTEFLDDDEDDMEEGQDQETAGQDADPDATTFRDELAAALYIV